MSRSSAAQVSKDRLAANFIVAIPAAVLLAAIWVLQKPKTPTVQGWGAPELPL